MNQLNLLQEKLQSSLISPKEQQALKGKRGKIFRTEFVHPTDSRDDYSQTRINSSGSSSSGSGTTTPSTSSSTSNNPADSFEL